MFPRDARELMVAISIFLAASGLINAQEPKTPGPPKPATARETPAQAVARFVEQLQRHPAQAKDASDRCALYLMDVTNGKETLIADQPEPGLTHCGSPVWSHDGRRILFDATPGTQWGLTRLRSIELGEGRPTLTDLGTGNCPTFARDDERIAFLSNADGVERGVWMMKADGSNRSLLGDYGRPVWSPDGRQLMIISFENPRQVTVMDANPAKSGALHLADYKFYADPTWADAGTIVAVIGFTEGDTVALVDVRDPSKAKVKDVLWRKANGPAVTPDFPIYSSAIRRSIFVGNKGKAIALYSVEQGKAEPAKRLGTDGHEAEINGVAFSPDGRYILYTVQGPDWTRGGVAPGVRDPAKTDQTAADR
jgi:dipeptidyl aminopeptidase/acylaminoacyl peptidase